MSKMKKLKIILFVIIALFLLFAAIFAEYVNIWIYFSLIILAVVLMFIFNPTNKYSEEFNRIYYPTNKVAKFISDAGAFIVLIAAILKILHYDYSIYFLISGLILLPVAILIEIQLMEKKLRPKHYINLLGLSLIFSGMIFKRYGIPINIPLALGIICVFISRFYYDIFPSA